MFVRRDVIFNESRFTYSLKNQDVGSSLDENMLDMTEFFQPVGELATSSDHPDSVPPKINQTPSVTVNTNPETNHSGDQDLIDNQLFEEIQHLATTPPDTTPIKDTSVSEITTDIPANISYQDPPNPLILDYLRQKVRPDYKQLHERGFVKKAKTSAITPKHGITIPKNISRSNYWTPSQRMVGRTQRKSS